MILPATIELRPALFGDGAKGSALQVYRNADLGVTRTAARESRNHPFVTVWTLDALPDREFPTYAALCQAALDLPEQQQDHHDQ